MHAVSRRAFESKWCLESSGGGDLKYALYFVELSRISSISRPVYSLLRWESETCVSASHIVEVSRVSVTIAFTVF